jgi:hypothetical protein
VQGATSGAEGLDEGFGDATEAEAGAEDGAARLDVADCLIGRFEEFGCGAIDDWGFGYRGAVESSLAQARRFSLCEAGGMQREGE